MRSVPSQRHEYLLLLRYNDEESHSSGVLEHCIDTSIERWRSGVCSCDARRLFRNEDMLATSFVDSFPCRELGGLHGFGERWCNFSWFVFSAFDDESGWLSPFFVVRPTVFGSSSPIFAFGVNVESLAVFFSLWPLLVDGAETSNLFSLSHLHSSASSVDAIFA